MSHPSGWRSSAILSSFFGLVICSIAIVATMAPTVAVRIFIVEFFEFVLFGILPPFCFLAHGTPEYTKVVYTVLHTIVVKLLVAVIEPLFLYASMSPFNSSRCL